jgi:hypothetical protein
VYWTDFNRTARFWPSLLLVVDRRNFSDEGADGGGLFPKSGGKKGSPVDKRGDLFLKADNASQDADSTDFATEEAFCFWFMSERESKFLISENSF